MKDFMKKIKSLLGIGEKLCDKCQHWQYCSDLHNPCPDCEQYAGEYHCKCTDYIENIEECKYFKPVKGGDKE